MRLESQVTSAKDWARTTQDLMNIAFNKLQSIFPKLGDEDELKVTLVVYGPKVEKKP